MARQTKPRKGGRPKQFGTVIKCKVSPAQKAVLEEAAGRAGASLSDWMRATLLREAGTRGPADM